MTINKFKAVKIKDVGKVITGKTPPTSQPELFGDKYPFITPSDISSFDVRYIDFVERGLSDKGFDKQKRYALPKDTVCYVCIGSTIGKVCLTNKVSFTNQQINSIVVNRDKFNPKYVYYLLRAETPKIQAISGGTGAGKAILNKSSFEDIDLNVFPLPIQNKIAAILSAYDDLIENNTRRIKILEEMAQTLYREWFVKFRFPGHEKVRMVDSELGPIPEGWEVKRLGDILSTIESGSRPKGGIKHEDKDVPSIGAENILGLGQYDYSKDKFVTREFFSNMKRGIIKSGDVLLYKDGAKLGRKSMFRDGFPHKECCINEHVFILRTNGECSQSYLFFWLDQREITQKIINLNTNAAQPGINQEGVKSLPILIPNRYIHDLFNEICEPILAQLFNLAKKNLILRRTRDLLLPKLISGELDVEVLDIAVGGD